MGIRVTGTLRNKNEKGFGFIVRDDGEADVFIHRTAFDRPGDWAALTEGKSRLEFTVVDGGKGPRADNVTAL